MGRVTKETQTSGFKKDQGFVITSEYDRNGNRIKMTSSLGAEVQNTYDKKGLLKTITAQTQALKEAQKQAWEAQLKHNALGQEIERSITGGLIINMQYDSAGRPLSQKVQRGQKDTYHRNYTWNANNRLLQTINAITGGHIHYAYDSFGNLASAQYEDGSYDYKLPDEVGNLYNTKDKKDRIYAKGGKLIKDQNWHYLYDSEGNLRLKSKRNIAQIQLQKREQEKEKPKKFSFFVEEINEEKNNPKTLDYYLRTDIKYTKEDKENYTKLKEQQEVQEISNQQWQRGDWEYTWYANGMLKSVKKPDGTIITMEYDALGRRTKKIYNEKTNRYLWDGNVLLHQWEYKKGQEAQTSVNDLGEVYLSQKEAVDDLVTWIYQERTFVPSAKIQGEEQFSIISDYLGRPVQSYDQQGRLVWQTDYDIYGKLRNLQGEKTFIPFRQLGQYEDPELDGLYYNRFRYYDASTGLYLSQDPIGLEGNNPTMYGYTFDSNSEVDPLGLEIPFGFKSYGQLKQFAAEIQSGIAKTGNGSRSPILLQGSSVSGRSFKTGELFDIGRTSDFDVAIVNPELLKKAEQLGLSKPGSGRSFPLDLDNPERAKALGLDKLQEKLSTRMGRDVNFRIFDSVDSARNSSATKSLMIKCN